MVSHVDPSLDGRQLSYLGLFSRRRQIIITGSGRPSFKSGASQIPENQANARLDTTRQICLINFKKFGCRSQTKRVPLVFNPQVKLVGGIARNKI